MPQNKRFTREELLFIKNNYKTLSVKDISKVLERSEKGVRAKIERMGIKLSTQERNKPFEWTRDHVKFLKTNYKELSDKKISIVLGTTYSVVLRKRTQLGLKKKHGNPYLHSGYMYSSSEKWVHRTIAERKIKRNLLKSEVVHHINGNKLDNNENNLYVCDKRKHGLVHHSLEISAFELYERGYIGFDEISGEYFVSDKLPIRTEG